MLLEVIVDINAGEKTLMMMWNEHVISYAGLGQDDLTRVLVDFVESHFHAVSDLYLYGKFVCHVTTLQQAGLITQEAMVDTIAQMQGKMDNKSMRRPHADPMTALAVCFPTLKLMTDSRGPEDGVLHMTSSKEAEEGRLWGPILPEIVSTDTNEDDMPCHGPHFWEPRKF